MKKVSKKWRDKHINQNTKGENTEPFVEKLGQVSRTLNVMLSLTWQNSFLGDFSTLENSKPSWK